MLKLLFALSLLAPMALHAQVRFPIVYVDMDGTSLGPDKQVRPATKEALAAYRECGGRVGIATGRTLEQAQPHLEALKPNLPLILFNGGATFGPDLKLVRSKALEPSVVGEVLGLIKGVPQVGVVVHYAKTTFVTPLNPEFERFLKASGITTQGIVTAEAKEAPIKIMVAGLPVQQPALVAALKPLEARFEVMVSSPETVEILPKGVNKATALAAVLAEQGKEPSDVLFFGDSGNDLEMMRYVPNSVAMANCRPATCEAALFVAKRNDTDTIAEIIRKLAIDPACKP